MSARATIVVPTLGRSPDLELVAERLRAESAEAAAELVWVAPEGLSPPGAAGAHERLVRYAGRAGFARAANLGVATAIAAGPVALVNDDAQVEPGWLVRLLAALDADPRAGAVQGVNLQFAQPGLADGCGLGWNRDWQAVQIGRDAPPPEGAPFEVFGVSATAALYRRAALADVAREGGGVFDERLGSWYEDVELAVRLRARGWRALCVPTARALHRGSATGATMPFARARLLARNRWLVVARLLGRRWPAALPRMAVRELRVVGRLVVAGEPTAALATVAGGLASIVHLPRFARSGPPLVAAAELERLRVGSLA